MSQTEENQRVFQGSEIDTIKMLCSHFGTTTKRMLAFF